MGREGAHACLRGCTGAVLFLRNSFSAEKLATRAGLAAFREVEMTEAGRVSGKSDA